MAYAEIKDAKRFRRVMTMVARTVCKRNTIPILSNVHVRFLEDAVELSATDLETGIIATVPAEVDGEADFTIDAHKLKQITEKAKIVGLGMTAPKITQSRLSRATPGNAAHWTRCHTEPSTVFVKTGKMEYKLAWLSAVDFPTMPDIDVSELLPADFHETLDAASAACSSDESRSTITGMLVEWPNRIIATNGHRLVVHEVKGSWENRERYIVPKAVVRVLKRTQAEAKKGTDTIEAVGHQDNHLVFRMGNVRLISRGVEGRFPAWEKAIPRATADDTTIVEFDREEMLEVLGMASHMAPEKGGGCKLEVNGKVEITTSNVDFGTFRATLEKAVRYGGNDFEVGLNASYLLDAIKNAPGDEPVLGQFRDSQTQVMFTVPGYRAVIMPLRMR